MRVLEAQLPLVCGDEAHDLVTAVQRAAQVEQLAVAARLLQRANGCVCGWLRGLHCARGAVAWSI